MKKIVLILVWFFLNRSLSNIPCGDRKEFKMKRILVLALFLTVLYLGQAGIAGAACAGSNPILCENGVTYYPATPDSVTGPLSSQYFNNVTNRWMTAGPFCSVSWSSPVNYAYKYLRTDSSGGCGGWWTTGLNFISLTVQYPGQSQKDGSYWVGAVNHLP